MALSRFIGILFLYSIQARITFDRDVDLITKSNRCWKSANLIIENRKTFHTKQNTFIATKYPTGCHYHLTNGTGYISIYFSGRVSGYFEVNQRYDVFGNASYIEYKKTEKGQTRNLSCSSEDPPNFTFPHFHEKTDRLRRSSNGLQYLEVIFVISNEIVEEWMNSNGQTNNEKYLPVYERFEGIFHMMSDHYMPADIQVVLLDIELWHQSNPAVPVSGYSSSDIMSSFKSWRFEQIRNANNDPDMERWLRHDAAQLFIPEKTFSSGVVGKAYTNVLCGAWAVGVIAADHSNSGAAIASTVSHEMAHNFGINHVDGSCTCGSRDCIMGAVMTEGSPPDVWSQCSLNTFRTNIPNFKCLEDIPPTHLMFGEPVCGNNIVEDGEDCDCGQAEECACCDPKTCQFLADAECSDGGCCSGCKLVRIGTRCRDAADDCDLPEYCTGKSETCPQNYFKQSGNKCDGGVGMCLDGVCKRPNDQCKMLWGSGAKSSPACMKKFNVEGTSYGNCNTPTSGSYYNQRCSEVDAVCGKQHCVDGDDQIVAEGFTWKRGQTIPFAEESLQCKVVLNLLKKSSFDEADPHMVQNGVPCQLETAESAFCVLGRCMAVTDYFPPCKNNCSSHGTCNNHDVCSCDCGWSGEDCSTMEWCHEYFIMTNIIIGVVGILTIIIIVVIYYVRTKVYGIPFWPMCPCKPTNEADGYTAGKSEPTQYQDQVFNPIPTITRAQIVTMNQAEEELQPPPAAWISQNEKPSRPAPTTPRDSPRPSRQPPAVPNQYSNHHSNAPQFPLPPAQVTKPKPPMPPTPFNKPKPPPPPPKF